MASLGIVAGVCQEIGLAACLGSREPSNRHQVSLGTATVAMILNGLGFSNPHFIWFRSFLPIHPLNTFWGQESKPRC